jgi:hypothetical protein
MSAPDNPFDPPQPDAKPPADDAIAFPIPRTADALHTWIETHLGVSLARRALIRGHTAPFDYILHTFFGDLCGSGLPPAAHRPEGRCHAKPDAVLWANRGGGKTFLGAVATALDLIFKPGIEIRILAGSLDQAERMHHHLRSFFMSERLQPLVQGRITGTRLRLTNSSRVELLAQSQTSVRGTRVQKLRCDELDVFDPHVWEAAQLTTRSARRGPWLVRGAIECLSTMHVPHGLMSRIIAEAREGKRALFRWNVLDVLERCEPERECSLCPLFTDCGSKAKEHAGGHISIDDAITQQSRVARTTWESEMLCLRPKRTDCVFPEFDPSLHIFDEAVDLGDRICLASMDLGYRTAAILWSSLERDGTVRIIGDRIARDQTLDRHVEALTDPLRPRPHWLAIDPAGMAVNDQTGRSALQVLTDAGLNIRTRRSEIAQGILAVRARLAPADGSPPRLLVHARCKRLIEALEKYRYDASRPDRDTPLKDGTHDHPIDALRYLVINLDHPRTLRQENYLG